MELCTAGGISNLSFIQPSYIAPKHIQSIHGKSRFPYISKQVGCNSGLRYCPKLSHLSVSSDGTTAETTQYDKDHLKPDVLMTVEATRADDNKDDYETKLNEVAEGSLAYSPLQLLKFMEDFNIKFDYEDTYSVVVFGSGAAVAIWSAIAVVGAVDSIPLLPKLLELIGLGYAVWFSSRNLIFKENRDEFLARVEQIKQQVLGSKDDN